VTSATKLVTPVVKVDDSVIGNGKPGSISSNLRALFYTQAEISS